jgi:cytochrome c-type biogenesis protein CcmH/NrfG
VGAPPAGRRPGGPRRGRGDERAHPPRDGRRALSGTLISALLVGLPALAFIVWPLLRRREDAAGLLARPADAREQLLERKHTALRSLRELAFEHEAGHISDGDYADLRARYEAEAAAVLTELDRLSPGPPAPEPPRREAPAPPARAWRHPAGIAVGAVALVAFGVALGVGIVRYTAPDPEAGAPMAGSRPLAPLLPGPEGAAPTAAAEAGAPRALSPEILQGMLQAARASLSAGRYGEAIAAYQAVLKREPRNVDAMTHLALIVAIGGHADQALESLDRALTIDPAYPPALLYRGQILYEMKQDASGAVRSWEKYMSVAPPGEDRDRVRQLIAEAKARPAPAPAPQPLR